MSGERKTPRRRFKEFQNVEAWEQRNVWELGEVITGSTPSTTHEEYYSNDGIPWVTPTDIDKNFIYDTQRKLSEEGQKVGRVVPKGSILITCIASIGKNTILGTMGSFNQQINCLVPIKEKYNPYFLFTESTLWSEKMKKEAAAGTMQIVNKAEFSEIKTMIPKLEEQQKIGDFFLKLDNLIAIHQRKLEKLKALKKAYLTQMFPSEGESKPKLRFAGFKDEWEECKLDTITDVRDGTHDSPSYYDNGHPFITSKNIKDGSVVYEDIQYISDKDYKEINKRSKVDKNDILMGMIGTVGNLALVRSEPNYAIKNVALIKDTQQINYIYLYHYLHSSNIKNQLLNGMDGGTQKFFALNKIRELNILFPINEEQSKIGSFFEHIDKLISLHQRKLEKLQNLKKAYLNEMFV